MNPLRPPALTALPVLAALTALALLPACSDDVTEPDPARTDLLTLHLGPSFVREYGDDGLLFVSGPDGALLDVAHWSGPGTVVLENAEERPGTIALTILNANDWEFVLATELGIPVGSSRTFDTVIRDGTPHTVDLTFLNAPACDRWTITLGGGAVSGHGLLPGQRTAHYNGVVTDGWVGLDLVGAAPVGAWLRGIEPGGALTLDFAAPGVLETLQRHAIALPAGGRQMSCWVLGDASTPATHDLFLFDSVYADESVPDSAVVHVPAFDPAGLSTSIFLYLDGEPAISLEQRTIGPVPSAFTPLVGELTITCADLDSLAFACTGQWDTCNITLSHGGELFGLWWFRGPAPLSTFVVPDLPEEITAQYPDYPREVFTLSSVGVERTTTEGDRTTTRTRMVWRTVPRL
jgi:hypothetical protein